MFRRIGKSAKRARSPPPLYEQPIVPTAKASQAVEVIETEESPVVIRATRMSNALLHAGNGNVWKDVHVWMKRKGPFRPGLVYGPTGCGKTCGLKEVANVCQYKIFEIEPSCVDSVPELQKWIKNITASKTLLGPRMILIDILEGMDSLYLKALEDILKKRSTFDIPIVFVTTDPYYYPLKSLVALFELKWRLFAPSVDSCINFGKIVTPRTSFDKLRLAAEMCHGDLRRMMMQANQDTAQDQSLSLFGTTTRYLLSKCDNEHWQSCAETYSLHHLLDDNILFCSTFRNLVEFEEYRSACFSVRHNDEYKLSVCGEAFRLSCNFQHRIPKFTLKSRVRDVVSHADVFDIFSALNVA